MARKSFAEKLHNSKNMPTVQVIEDPASIARYGGTKMLIAPPLDYDAVMRKVPEGKLITVDRIRSYLAKRQGADFTCPLTAGIFVNIAARAAAETGDGNPYWRTLKKGGELNEKYPGGLAGHKAKLQAEGHTVVQKGKRFFVEGVEMKLWEIKA